MQSDQTEPSPLSSVSLRFHKYAPYGKLTLKKSASTWNDRKAALLSSLKQFDTCRAQSTFSAAKIISEPILFYAQGQLSHPIVLPRHILPGRTVRQRKKRKGKIFITDQLNQKHKVIVSHFLRIDSKEDVLYPHVILTKVIHLKNKIFFDLTAPSHLLQHILFKGVIFLRASLSHHH